MNYVRYTVSVGLTTRAGAPVSRLARLRMRLAFTRAFASGTEEEMIGYWKRAREGCVRFTTVQSSGSGWAVRVFATLCAGFADQDCVALTREPVDFELVDRGSA